MKHRTRSFWLPALVVFCATTASAQAPSPAPATAPANNTLAAQAKAETVKPAGRPDRNIERIHTQDAGVSIDELRVGGETQSITVQPAANVPAYEIKPADKSRSSTETGTTGSRFWNILKF